MASGRGASSRWFFSREQLENTPSRRCGVEADKELSYRQQAANFIQDMGQRLNVSQLTINTAIVYMHRFYMHHSFTKFNRNGEGGGLKLNLSFLGSSLACLITTTQEIHNGMRALHTIGLVWIH